MAGLPRVVRAIAKLAYGASLPPGTYEDAAACYAKAASLAPRRLVHRVELGRSLAKAGRFEEAERQLEAALSLEVEDVNAHLQRADAEIMLAALRYDDKVKSFPSSSSSTSNAKNSSSKFPSGYSSAATRAKAWQGSLAPENLAAAALAAGVRDARRSAEEASAAASAASHAGGGSSEEGSGGNLLRWLGVPPPVPAAFGMGREATRRSLPPRGGGGVGKQQQQRGRERKQKEEQGQRNPLGRLQQQLLQIQEQLQQLQQQQQQQQLARRRGHHHHHHHHKRGGGGGGGSEKAPPAVPS